MKTGLTQHWAHDHHCNKNGLAFPTGSSLAGGVFPPERQLCPSCHHSKGPPMQKGWGLSLLTASGAPTLWLWWGQPSSPSPTSPVCPLSRYDEGLPVPALAWPLAVSVVTSNLPPHMKFTPWAFLPHMQYQTWEFQLVFNPQQATREKGTRKMAAPTSTA